VTIRRWARFWDTVMDLVVELVVLFGLDVEQQCLGGDILHMVKIIGGGGRG